MAGVRPNRARASFLFVLIQLHSWKYRRTVNCQADTEHLNCLNLRPIARPFRRHVV
jgi:hypothetical protein